MQQYTTFTILENKDLKIALTEAGKEYAKEAIDLLNSEKHLDAFPGIPRGLWNELNEYAFCNGYWDIPDQYKGLTEAPMISDSIIDEETTQLEYDHVNIWAFMDYQVRDELRILLEEGEVVFPLQQAFKPLPATPDDIWDDYVNQYAAQVELNIDTPENWRECRNELFNRVTKGVTNA